MIREHKEAQKRSERKGMYDSRNSSLSGLNKNWSKSKFTDKMSQSQA